MGSHVRSPATVLALLFVWGCASPPRGAPTELGHGYRREGHPTFSPQEQKAVTTARHAIEQDCGKRIDAYYRVKQTPDGYVLLVLTVHRYEHKQPMFTIGSDWDVSLKQDGTVTHIFQGY